jgi:hypothetical protein
MKRRLPFSRLAAAILVASTACGAFPSQVVDSTDLASVANTSLAGYRKPCPMPSSAFPQLFLPSPLTPSFSYSLSFPVPSGFRVSLADLSQSVSSSSTTPQTSTFTCSMTTTHSLSKP